MQVISQGDKIGLIIDQKDDFQRTLNTIKQNIFPQEYDSLRKMWLTNPINLLILPEYFPQADYTPQTKQIQQKLSQRLEQIRLLKKTPYMNPIPLLRPETKLMEHQKIGVNWLLSKNTLLADDMGLGKTLQTIATMCVLLDTKQIEKIFVVCPNSVVYTWKHEIQKHSMLTCEVLSKKKDQRLAQLQTPQVQVLITNYESLIERKSKTNPKTQMQNNLLQKETERYINNSTTLLVIDEAHKIKSPTSKITKQLIKWSKNPRKILLTGTPVDQHPENIFSLFKFLDGGRLLGTNYSLFLKQYCYLDTTWSLYAPKVVGYKNLDKLKFIISLNCLRRTKNQTDLNLPEKIYKDLFILPSSEQFSFYENLKETIKKEFQENDQEPLVYLTQAASNPFLVKKQGFENTIQSSKLQALDNLLEEHINESKQKVVLWTNFVDNFPFFLNRYKEYNPLFINGSIPPEKRQDIINQFQTNSENKLIICNPQACSTGITITAASVAIFYDKSFKVSDYHQAIDRIHRIGQTRTCLIINLLLSETIDEAIHHSIQKKTTIIKYLQNDSKTI